MLIYVNNTPVEVFEGALVCDALNKYFTEKFIPYDPVSIRILDLNGNIVFKDGSLSQYDRIFITEF
jgi:hypothetical protein